MVKRLFVLTLDYTDHAVALSRHLVGIVVIHHYITVTAAVVAVAVARVCIKQVAVVRQACGRRGLDELVGELTSDDYLVLALDLTYTLNDGSALKQTRGERMNI